MNYAQIKKALMERYHINEVEADVVMEILQLPFYHSEEALNSHLDVVESAYRQS